MDRCIIIRDLISFRMVIVNSLYTPIKSRLGVTPGFRISDLLNRIAQMTSYFQELDCDVDIGSHLDDDQKSVLRWCLAHKRLCLAREQALVSKKAVDPGVIKRQLATLEPYDKELKQPWARDLRHPNLRLAEYMTIDAAQDLIAGEYDDELEQNFRILHAKSAFTPNLFYYRERCNMRGLPLAIAFMDIDGFKSLNDNNSETVVDQNFLRLFMMEIEAAVYYHGEAYRYGGDEFAVILPNRDVDGAVKLLHELQERVEATKNPLNFRPKLSIGLCVIDANCILSEEEVLQRANHAEKLAKKKGKNTIVSCDAQQLDMPESGTEHKR